MNLRPAVSPLRFCSAAAAGAAIPALVESLYLGVHARERFADRLEWCALALREWGVYGWLSIAFAIGVVGGTRLALHAARLRESAAEMLFAAATAVASAGVFTWWLSGFWSERSAPLYRLRRLPLGAGAFALGCAGFFVVIRTRHRWLPLVTRRRRPILVLAALGLLGLQWRLCSYFPDSIAYFHFRMAALQATAWTLVCFAASTAEARLARSATLLAVAAPMALTLGIQGVPNRADTTLRSRSIDARATLEALNQACDFDGDGAGAAWCFGGRDPVEWSTARGPYRRDVPGNGIDENGVAGDARQPPRPPVPPPPPGMKPIRNLLWISIDTIRDDDATRILRQTLGQFRAQAWDFKHAYTAHTGTHFSLPSTATSRLLPSTWTPNEHETVASVLRARGYLTAAAFEFEVKPERAGEAPTYFKGVDRITHDTTPTGIARLSTALRADGRPVFLWIHDLGAHMPRFGALSSRAFADGWRRTEYERLLRDVDAWLGVLFAILKRDGWFEDTAIVVFSDHGELMGEHGRYFHAKTPYEPLGRIPLAIRAPGLQPSVRDAQVSALDIAPTSLAMLGVATPATFQGRSLFGDVASAPVITIVSSDSWCPDRSLEYAVVDASRTWKLIESTWYSYTELFALERDPHERVDVAALHPEPIAALRRIYDDASSDGWPSARPCPPAD